MAGITLAIPLFMQKLSTRTFSAILFVAVASVATPAHADIGLMVYDSISADPYILKAGHAGVFLSNICQDSGYNRFRVCTDDDRAQGVTGTMIQRYSHLDAKASQKKGELKDWIALPLNVNLYGTRDKNAAPIVGTKENINLLRENAYQDESLHLDRVAKPDASKKDGSAPEGNWKYSIGANQLRGSHLVSVPTTSQEDEHLVDWLNDSKNVSHFNQFVNNCANFADTVFRVAKGKQFNGRGYFEDYGMTTPLSDAKAVKRWAKKADVPYTVTTFNQTPSVQKSSSTPTEMSTDSNSNLMVNLPMRMVPSHGSLMFTGAKFLRKMGVPLPGFRAYMDLGGKEVLEHGTPELAQLTYNLQHAKKAKNKDEEVQFKEQLNELQNETFGSKFCWKDKRAEFAELIHNAVADGVVDPKLEKEFKINTKKNMIMRMIPMASLRPNKAKLISMIASGPGVEVKETDDGYTLTKEGVTAGMSRTNIEKHDPKLGFLIMAASIVYQLDSDQKLMAKDFDSDWELMVRLGVASGIYFEASPKASVQACSIKHKADTFEDSEVQKEKDDLTKNDNCAECAVPSFPSKDPEIQ